MPPNVSKILIRWGLGEELAERALKLETMHFNKWETGEFLGIHVWSEEMLTAAGGDFMYIRHSDLREILYNTAKSLGAQIRTGAQVVSIDPYARSVTLQGGEVLKADVVVGADGPYGVTRKTLMEEDHPQSPMGFMMYETVIPAEEMKKCPELKGVTLGDDEPNRLQLWWGVGSCIFFFPLNHKKAYAIHYIKDDDGQEGDWEDGPSVDLAKVVGSTCEPRIRKLAQLSRPATRVRPTDYNKLETWVHNSQHVVVIGEAAHPFPPGSLQGTAMSIEDAAVLGKLFSHLRNTDQIPSLLNAFEDIRQTRCLATLSEELGLFTFLTYKDDTMQDLRDSAFREKYARGSTDTIAGEDEAARQWEEMRRVYAYDCEDEADEWWVKWGVLRERAMGREGNVLNGGIRRGFAMEAEVSIHHIA
ncbi:hypothetical protein NLI96_g4422 [Meripilus lineatus]|uniref:FAD-binding domain-containing protein n=1 Tax=Meripilus lineatus TaxID=2056292 RepID=A0AAD5V6M3_9APHY|nr:hypothetical protein NLI96_g4422 [Physisporinus lineatus]